MKKEFFNQMLSKLDTASNVEILTDPETRMLKGGGCTCKKTTNGFSCNGYNDNDPTTTTVDPTLQLPK